MRTVPIASVVLTARPFDERLVRAGVKLLNLVNGFVGTAMKDATLGRLIVGMASVMQAPLNKKFSHNIACVRACMSVCAFRGGLWT